MYNRNKRPLIIESISLPNGSQPARPQNAFEPTDSNSLLLGYHQ
jgi:hypothetical protein